MKTTPSASGWREALVHGLLPQNTASADVESVHARFLNECIARILWIAKPGQREQITVTNPCCAEDSRFVNSCSAIEAPRVSAEDDVPRPHKFAAGVRRTTLKQVIRPVLSAYAHVLALVGVNEIRRGPKSKSQSLGSLARGRNAQTSCPVRLSRAMTAS